MTKAKSAGGTGKTDEVGLMTVEAVAEYLSVHPQTVRVMIRTGELPAIDIAPKGSRIHTWRVDEQDLRAWIASRREQASHDDA